MGMKNRCRLPLRAAFRRPTALGTRILIAYCERRCGGLPRLRMKLAEALLKRADVQRDISNLVSRIVNNVLVQEGDEPAADPETLLGTYAEKTEELEGLVQAINATNAATSFSDTETIADAIARRDMLSERRRTYRMIYDASQIRAERHSGNEIRFVRCIDLRQLQKKIDDTNKEYRELDMKLQQLNWTVDLIEKN